MTNPTAEDFQETDNIEGEIEVMPPEIYAANLIEWAVDRHASDLFVSDDENCVVVAVRRLGKVEMVRRLARAYGRRLQGHLRVLAGADAGETVRPSEGRGDVRTPNGNTVDLRMSCLPTLFGQDVSIRLFDPVRGSRNIEQLGWDEVELDIIRKLLSKPSGLVLVAGPVASGKSSTLYASLDYLNDGSRKIHTLEDPIEHSLSGIMQSQVNLKAGLDFSELLSAVLRHSPDVIMVGEIRDKKTAATAVRAGASGQLVLATIHAKSAAEAAEAILHYDANPKFLSGSLIGVINQRLIRRLCNSCRGPISIDQSELHITDHVAQRLNGHSPELYRSVGCEECFRDGFSRVTCLPEIMLVGDELSDAIANRASSSVMEEIATREGMLTLCESAALRVYRGETTASEANRIMMSGELAGLAAAAREAAGS